MAHEYALVHVKFTIPLAILLTIIAYPIINRNHVLQVTSLVVVAFVSTIPWDAYLIRHSVWTYPPTAIIGPRLFEIPIEELFFFVIQTYITSLVYVILNKPCLHVLYLESQRNPPSWIRQAKLTGQVLFVVLTLVGAHLLRRDGTGTYLGLILVWASPFCLLTWTIAGRFIISLPWTSTVLPIVLPTVYLWLVDELALGRGTWSIESGTKLEVLLFGALEIEEAVFFLATNTLIVFGLASFDQFLAVIYASPRVFPQIPRSPTPLMLVESRFLDTANYDLERVRGISDAVDVLRRKSRSFYLANGLFSGRLRIDLILLYSFCRLADDLIDDATSEAEVVSWISKLTRFLDMHYKDGQGGEEAQQPDMDAFVAETFPETALAALKLLPTNILPPEPLYLLIEGFKMDSQFPARIRATGSQFPISDEARLKRYAHCVAGTVGELCVALIIHHCEPGMDESDRLFLRAAACKMGTALQYVNVARDITTDARIGRVYLPTTWLAEEGLTAEMVIKQPSGPAIERLRRRLLAEAFSMYKDARPSMESIPADGRGPMIAAVETYMEIGRVLLEKSEFRKEEGRATVPLFRRLRTALRALYQCS